MSDIHVDTTSSQVFPQFLVYTPAYTCSHILTNEHDPHHYDVVSVGLSYVSSQPAVPLDT